VAAYKNSEYTIFTPVTARTHELPPCVSGAPVEGTGDRKINQVCTKEFLTVTTNAAIMNMGNPVTFGCRERKNSLRNFLQVVALGIAASAGDLPGPELIPSAAATLSSSRAAWKGQSEKSRPVGKPI